MILLLDNYDSFVFNLARYLVELGAETEVVRTDAVSVSDVSAKRPDAIVISPGPCGPREAGISLDVVRELGSSVPILGVCLGHQVIAEAYGGRVVRGDPCHGRTSDIEHDERSIFAGLPNPLTAARYHSLVVEPQTLPRCLRVTARTGDDLIMGIEHRTHPVFGVQFHPESVLTDHGHRLLAGFLREGSIRERAARSA